MFDLDKQDLRKLLRFYNRSPRQFRYATADILTTFAVNTRKEALKIIHDDMNIRNQNFVVSRVRFGKARGINPVGQQESKTYSVKGPRFSGWLEQETGAKTGRSRVATTFARGGTIEKQIKPSFRLKPGKDFLDLNDFSGDTDRHRLAALFRFVSSTKYTRPFVVRKSKKFKPGLYKRQRNKIKRLQDFSPRNVQPKRTRWMTRARKNNFKRLDVRGEWVRAINRQLKY